MGDRRFQASGVPLISVSIDVGGLERKLNLIADSVKDVDPALRLFDKHLARRIQRRFDSGGPGWEPLSEEQAGRREAAAGRSFMRKVGREGMKAAAKFAKAKFDYNTGLDDSAAEVRAALAKRRKAAEGGLARRLLTYEEARRLVTGEASSGALKPKAQAKLEERHERAKARGGRVLGRIADSFKSKIRRGELVRESEIPWAGVHNEGGVVGHGAEVPARPFIFLDDRDVEVLVGILDDSMMLAAES